MTNTVIIDGIEYAPVTKGGEKTHIVIIDNRGLTFVGEVDLSTDEYPKVIRNAQCIIRWGTTGHLAELAEKSPKMLTKCQLGHMRDVMIYSPPIASYECEEDWYE